MLDSWGGKCGGVGGTILATSSNSCEDGAGSEETKEGNSTQVVAHLALVGVSKWMPSL